MKSIRTVLLLLTAMLTATACIPTAFVAGAAAGGAIVYDQRSMKTMMHDRDMVHHITRTIDKDTDLKNTQVQTTSFNGKILLTGQTTTARQRARIGRIAQTTPKIRRVNNAITVSAPLSIRSRSEDTWITTKVKSMMLAEKGLRSSQIKVVTEDKVVYLMGIVSKKQGRIAAEVARRVSGVRRVVKMFEYL